MKQVQKVKKKKIKSRTGPTLYSAEYLQKKHGLSLDEKSR